MRGGELDRDNILRDRAHVRAMTIIYLDRDNILSRHKWTVREGLGNGDSHLRDRTRVRAMTEVYRVNYQGYLTTRWRTSVLTNEANLAAVLVRCQTKGMVYTSGNTKMVDSGIVSVQGRAALRARWNLNKCPPL